MKPMPGSFRDPSGQVFEAEGRIVRTVSHGFSEHWEACVDSGFLSQMTAARKLIPFVELSALGPNADFSDVAWKLLEVERIPCITYPYEWCFSQLQDAALLTLDVQDEALSRGLILKDASAYNVQFVGVRPIFIDLLSFEKHEQGRPWAAYRQFCRHFLAPLALSARLGLWCGSMSRLWIDGIPLAHACAMLPWRSRLNVGLGIHLYAHARMEARHADARKAADKARAVTMSVKSLQNFTQSLRSCILSLRPAACTTEWGDYYTDTNYTEAAQKHKSQLVDSLARQYSGALAVDMGANTGLYSRMLSPHFATVVAADIDPLAVERHYRILRDDTSLNNVLPMVLDLGNPSPALGWACAEREAFAPRMQASFVTALALIHHLVITAGIPLRLVAAYFADMVQAGGHVCMEFVPKEDSQVQRLLAARPDIFDDYTLKGFIQAFEERFTVVAQHPIEGSLRTLFDLQRKN